MAFPFAKGTLFDWGSFVVKQVRLGCGNGESWWGGVDLGCIQLFNSYFLPTMFNFDEIIERRTTRSIKWGLFAPDVLPMWVADMDFRVPAAIETALQERVSHGIFGYDFLFADLQERVCERMARLYQWKITPADVVLIPGLVVGFNVAARAVCQAGDGVLVQPPVYHPMLHVAGNQQLENHFAPLQKTQTGRILHYQVDLPAFAQAIRPNTRLFLLCHPHNPVGRIWNQSELHGMAEYCIQNNVIICSDEIHSELLLDGHTHTPLAALAPEIADQTITLIAPSKTFNIPGLDCGFAIIQNPTLRKRYEQAMAGLVPHVVGMGLTAGYAAFGTETDAWLKALLAYLSENARVVREFVEQRLPKANYTIPEATYLAWLDLSGYALDMPAAKFLLEKAKVGLNDGAMFGLGGEGFVRLNFGCPRAVLLEGLERIANAL
ncbi:MAG TPA: PatB family C-S lyase [Anaerolineales bacterium]|nr:PatB family C-S lyase [Anaerolineales bacterium]